MARLNKLQKKLEDIIRTYNLDVRLVELVDDDTYEELLNKYTSYHTPLAYEFVLRHFKDEKNRLRLIRTVKYPYLFVYEDNDIDLFELAEK